ncbi:MAG TPA: hypothetical protein VMR98_03460 [Candidatus Polarisedimenticolaceae bacterium]|nr:hypothetical protein [Candidatus Polarisedimenticolaceae bacterium]
MQHPWKIRLRPFTAPCGALMLSAVMMFAALAACSIALPGVSAASAASSFVPATVDACPPKQCGAYARQGARRNAPRFGNKLPFNQAVEADCAVYDRKQRVKRKGILRGHPHIYISGTWIHLRSGGYIPTLYLRINLKEVRDCPGKLAAHSASAGESPARPRPVKSLTVVVDHCPPTPCGIQRQRGPYELSPVFGNMLKEGLRVRAVCVIVGDPVDREIPGHHISGSVTSDTWLRLNGGGFIPEVYTKGDSYGRLRICKPVPRPPNPQ